MTPDQPPTVDPQHVISALSQELARINDNRIYLIALLDQQGDQMVRQGERVAELEAQLHDLREAADAGYLEDEAVRLGEVD